MLFFVDLPTQNPGYLITSLGGAEVEVEQTCFTQTVNGRGSVPILFFEKPLLTYKLQNHVGGTWDCDFVGARLEDGNITCEAIIPDADTCQSTAIATEKIVW